MESIKKNIALVVGGNGIIGRNVFTYLKTTGNWDVIVTSHSLPNYDIGESVFVQLDLTDPDAVEKQKELLERVTHIFFGAYIEGKTLKEQTEVNAQLMENLVTGIEKIAPDFQHITFIQGCKAYGTHLGMYKTPAKETDQRHFPPNFYYSQEDFLRRQSIGKNGAGLLFAPM